MSGRFLGSLVALLGCSPGALAANSAEDVPKVLNQIAKIEYEKDPTAAMRLLEQLQSFDHWGIGGGRGPTDRTSLSMALLVVARDFLPWDSKPGEIPPSSSGVLQSWLQADPRSTEAMLSMLGSRDPLSRWIALTKLRALGTAETAVLGKLEEFAQTDGYFVIRRQPASTLEGSEHVFDVPLRRSAIETLRTAGRDVALPDVSEVSRQGLRWLAGHYLSRHSDKLSKLGIVGALRQLAAKTPEIIAAQAALAAAQTPADIMVLFEKLAGDRAPSPKSREGPLLNSPRFATQQPGEKPKSTTPAVNQVPVSRSEKEWPMSWTIGATICLILAALTLFVLRSRR